jgi:hypothetical protein
MARLPHLVRNNGTDGNFRSPCRYHRRVRMNKWPAQGISLSPSGIHSLSCLNPIPSRDRRVYTGQCHDRVIAQHTAEGQYY